MCAATSRIARCRVEDGGPGEPRRIEAAAPTLPVFNLHREFCVTDDHCTHGPGSLSEGFIDGDLVECNFHQGVFNIRTGECVRPPCMVPVKTYKTVVEGGRVYIEM